MNRNESTPLSFISTKNKFNLIREIFFKDSELNNEVDESIWEEISVKNDRKDLLLKKLENKDSLSNKEIEKIRNEIEIEPDFFPEQKSISFEQQLLRMFESRKKVYLNSIKHELYVKSLNPEEKINLIQFLKEDLEEIIDAYEKSKHLEKYKNLRNKLISDLNSIYQRIDELDFKISDISLDKNKIKFNLSKKEVCILFEYLSKHNLIADVHSREELGKLIESHAMYESKGNYHFITNAKNTLSKNQNDLEHQSLSKTLSEHLKLYK